MIANSIEVAQTLSVESKGNQLFSELVIDRLPGYQFIELDDSTDYGMTLQLQGIDYYCVTPDALIPIEVKTERKNRWKTLFLEMYQDIGTCKPGWLQTCRSKLLIYQFLDEKSIYVMSMDEVRSWLLESPLFYWYPVRTQKARNLPTTAAGFSVPLADMRLCLKHFFEIKQQTPRDVISAALTLAIHE